MSIIDATGRYGSDLKHNVRIRNLTTPGLDPPEVAELRRALRNPIFLVNGLHTAISNVVADPSSLRLAYDPMCLYWNGESEETGGTFERLLVLSGSTDEEVLYHVRILTHQIGIARQAFTGTMPVTIMQRVDGPYIRAPRDFPELQPQLREELEGFSWFAAAALTVINQPRLVTSEAAQLTPQLSRRWERKPQQRVDYRVIRLPDGRKTHGRSVEVDGVPAGIALHSVRGHFASYGAENPLFGRITGTYWRRPHLRGNAKYGQIGHDYNLHPTDTDVS